jgi:hypothetical protein
MKVYFWINEDGDSDYRLLGKGPENHIKLSEWWGNDNVRKVNGEYRWIEDQDETDEVVIAMFGQSMKDIGIPDDVYEDENGEAYIIERCDAAYNELDNTIYDILKEHGPGRYLIEYKQSCWVDYSYDGWEGDSDKEYKILAKKPLK